MVAVQKLVGQVLGQYQIIEPVGHGGMGTVFRGTHVATGREAAVKVMLSHLGDDEEALKRFEREIQAIVKLEHPHIVPVIDYGTDDSISFIVMRLLKGGTMSDWLKTNGRYDLTAAAKPVEQISRALSYAHRKGVVHRDIKPANILFDGERNAYLSDFGVAKVLGQNNTQLTGTAGGIGTPDYAAPEQWVQSDVDNRADVYALGAVVYHMLTGIPPFKGETPFATIKSHFDEALTPASAVHPGVPLTIDFVLETALAKGADDRYQSVEQFVSAFKAAIAGRFVSNGKTTHRRPVGAVLPASETAILAETVSHDGSRTIKWYLLAAAMLVALLLVFVFVLQDGEGDAAADNSLPTLANVLMAEVTATPTLTLTFTPTDTDTPQPSATTLPTNTDTPQPSATFIPTATEVMAVTPRIVPVTVIPSPTNNAPPPPPSPTNDSSPPPPPTATRRPDNTVPTANTAPTTTPRPTDTPRPSDTPVIQIPDIGDVTGGIGSNAEGDP